MYPMVDNGGRHESGIIASEFPIYNYVVYLISIPLGYAHWYGRLINLILSTLSMWFFYKLLRFYFTETEAFNSTLILTLSIWFSFSRKSMPDIFSMSLMLIALYQVIKFLNEGRFINLLLYGLLASCAVLAKLPAIFALSVLAIPLVSKIAPLIQKVCIVFASLIVVVIAYWWYFIWGSYLLETFEYQLYFPQNLQEGLKAFLPYWKLALEQFYFSALQSFIAFGVFIIGLIVITYYKRLHPILILSCTLPVFLLFILKTGNVFALHNYYIIPFVPVMALIAGIGLSALPKKIYPFILIIISIEAIANQQHDFFIKKSEWFKLSLENDINKRIPQNNKIALAGSTGPQYLYFAHRKGWGLSVEQALDTNYVNTVKSRGYSYMVCIKREFNTLPIYPILDQNESIIIYALGK